MIERLIFNFFDIFIKVSTSIYNEWRFYFSLIITGLFLDTLIIQNNKSLEEKIVLNKNFSKDFGINRIKSIE